MSTRLSLVYQICFKFWTNIYVYMYIFIYLLTSLKSGSTYTGQTCLTYIVNMYFTQTGFTCVADRPVWSSHYGNERSKTTRVCLNHVEEKHMYIGTYCICFLVDFFLLLLSQAIGLDTQLFYHRLVASTLQPMAQPGHMDSMPRWKRPWQEETDSTGGPFVAKNVSTCSQSKIQNASECIGRALGR